MHPSDRVDPILKNVITSELYRLLADYASGGKFGVIAFYKTYERLIEKLHSSGHLIKGITHTGYGAYYYSQFPDQGVPNEIAVIVRQVFWELYLERIIAPSPTGYASDTKKEAIAFIDFDFFVITSYGMTILLDTQSRVQVHDPHSYLANFWNSKPSPDAGIMRYLTEATHTFKGGHLLATVVLLGTASDQLIDLVASAIDKASGGSWLKNTYQQKSSTNLVNRFEAVVNKLNSDFTPVLLERGLKEELRYVVPTVFHLIRSARNDIAHPSGREFTWNEVSGFLHCFVGYYLCLNQIIGTLTRLPKSDAADKSSNIS